MIEGKRKRRKGPKKKTKLFDVGTWIQADLHPHTDKHKNTEVSQGYLYTKCRGGGACMQSRERERHVMFVLLIPYNHASQHTASHAPTHQCPRLFHKRQTFT